MRLLLDACVLYPNIMRETLLGAAKAGAFTPLWSGRILEEWARAAARLGPEGEVIARGEIAALKAAWPAAEAPVPPHDDLVLPDPNDAHVLAAAIGAQAAGIVTLNLSDFPTRVLARHDVLRFHPDAFLADWAGESPDAACALAARILADVERFSGEAWTQRRLFKKARLPRFAKAVAG
ncbi:RSP_2648 family PIN domain-containing protein [Paracoccaceae bacterium GXU_MW_L88]